RFPPYATAELKARSFAAGLAAERLCPARRTLPIIAIAYDGGDEIQHAQHLGMHLDDCKLHWWTCLDKVEAMLRPYSYKLAAIADGLLAVGTLSGAEARRLADAASPY